ncbi:hypothetical protein K435DRAFT_848589 [Dendrothele bispora CBS 962.96]|uniref:Uncharacterized protein n=1 Tax=Dendrothele bispora (strain CBS 962.96) TaxID=1314807 RepID=A0A4S8MUK4_DENBC|nr:hypothetical protein K435DRAFT_848589 [Dendrothele bispora CBS 962.96]
MTTSRKSTLMQIADIEKNDRRLEKMNVLLLTSPETVARDARPRVEWTGFAAVILAFDLHIGLEFRGENVIQAVTDMRPECQKLKTDLIDGVSTSEVDVAKSKIKTHLQTQIWDAQQGVGVDLVIDAEDAAKGLKSTGPSQTERTRLKSLLIGGVATLDEWIEGKPMLVEDGEGEGDETLNEDVRDVESFLKGLGLQEDFDNLFSRSLDELRDVVGFDSE